MRFVVLSCAVLASYVVFIATVAFGSPCFEHCPDDGADGRCPPMCVTCACAPHPAPPAPVAKAGAPATLHAAIVPPAIRVPGGPEPRDIFHVPKSLLA